MSRGLDEKIERWSIMSTAIRNLHRFCIPVLCDWSRKLHHPLSQSYAKLKPIATWVTRVLPRSRPVALVYIEVSLAPSAIFLCSDRPMWLTWFWFYDTQSKGALQLCFDIIVVVNWWCVGRTIYKRAQGKTVIFFKETKCALNKTANQNLNLNTLLELGTDSWIKRSVVSWVRYATLYGC